LLYLLLLFVCIIFSFQFEIFYSHLVAGYKMMSGEKHNDKDPHKKAAADHQADKAKGADAKK
jgi:hypothetical protein